MKFKELPTQERLKELFDYDQYTGVFTRISGRRGYKIGSEAGFLTSCRSKTYRSIRIDNKTYSAHRLAIKFITGEDPEGQIDHVNGDGLDNRVDNLRVVTSSENSKNMTIMPQNKSGFTGVFYSKRENKWRAMIRVDRKAVGLGYFDSMLCAVAARMKANSEYGFHANHGLTRSAEL